MKFNSNLITRRLPWHANMTEANHLGRALMIKPDVFQDKMTQIFTSKNYFSDNPLSSVLFSSGRTIDTNSREWEWSLKGANTRPLVTVEKVELSAQPGRFNTSFKLKLDENWYIAGDIITPGTTNKKYQSRIQENPVRSGNGWVYTLRLMSDDPKDFIPTKYLEPGIRWGKLYSQYEEGAEQSGSTQYSMPIMLKNKMGRLRKMYEVTGDVSNEVLAVKIPDSKGKLHSSWINYAEVEYWQQWYREIERNNWYSRSTQRVMGATGRPVVTGPGIQQQLEDSHIHRYTHLTSKLIEEYLMDIFYARVKPGSRRSIKAYTGEYGMLLFHRAMKQLIRDEGWQIVGTNFKPIVGAKSEYHNNAYAVGYQFVKYMMANGIELELIHNPLYDDQEINFEIDPVTGRPMESMRITFLDFSGEGKDSNIKMVTKTNGLKFGYVAGLTSPYGPIKGKLMSHSGDYYSMHIQKEFGVHVEDVTRCGELILSRN